MTLNSHHITATLWQQQATSKANHLQLKGSSSTTALTFVLIFAQRHIALGLKSLLPSNTCPSPAKSGLEETVSKKHSSKLVTSKLWADHPCHYKGHIHVIKAKRAAGVGWVSRPARSLQYIFRSKKDIRRTYYDHWIHACKNYLLDFWLSAAHRATQSFERKNK